MKAQPVIAVFDVGKTNKKLFLFDEDYKIVYEKSARFNETADEDGQPCENLDSLRSSVYDSLNELSKLKQFAIKAINFSTYGASFVYIDGQGEPLTPLYNYLKPLPEAIRTKFYADHGDEDRIAMETASPALNNLNSGLQVYSLKQQQPAIFKKIAFALHLPQYLSYLLSKTPATDMTSIGCHTALWDFSKHDYHQWVYAEGIDKKFAPIIPGDEVFDIRLNNEKVKVGTGLHDSSAALIPYLVSFRQPFVLISTGTWAISLNPFNTTPLTAEELKQDSLNYLQYKGLPVKASRLFAGYEYEKQVKRIAAHFNEDEIKYRSILFDAALVNNAGQAEHDGTVGEIAFANRDLAAFDNDIAAYHQLVTDIIAQQKASTQLVLNGTKVKRIFVDGGFSKNSVYMHMLAAAFPNMEVYAASMAQATAVGTALAIHDSWNTKPQPNDLIELKYYSVKHSEAL